MTQKPINTPDTPQYEDIEVQVGTCEGTPIIDTITAEEQEDFVRGGYGSVQELIDFHITTYRDWQCDC